MEVEVKGEEEGEVNGDGNGEGNGEGLDMGVRTGTGRSLRRGHVDGQEVGRGVCERARTVSGRRPAHRVS